MKKYFYLVSLFLFWIPVIAENAYVSNTLGNSVTVIDADSKAVLDTFTGVVSLPRAIAVHPDGTVVYVGEQNNNRVRVLDAFDGSVQATIGVGSAPVGIVFTSDGNKAYVLAQRFGSNGSVVVLDTSNSASPSISSSITVGDFAQSIAISSDDALVGVANIFSNTVNIIDTATDTVARTIGSVPSASWIAFDPNGSGSEHLIAVSRGTPDSVTFIDADTGTVIGSNVSFNGVFALTFTPDGTEVYATSTSEDNLKIIDVDSRSVTKTVSVGNNPFDIAFRENGQEVYIVNNDSNNASVVNKSSESVVATIGTGSSPDSISFSPVDPSTTATGGSFNNAFFSQIDYFNVVNWTSVSSAVKYLIYRDAGLTDLAFETTDLTFIDHHRTLGLTDTYYIAILNGFGQIIQVAQISITPSG